MAFSVPRSVIVLTLVFAVWIAPIGTARAEPAALTIFHADSLIGYVTDLAREFEASHRGVEVRHVGVGSLDAIRRVTDLHLPCDILVTADWRLLDRPLAGVEPWVMIFAGNSLGLLYTGHSASAGEIDGDNWYRILTRGGVRYAHSNPERDPAGYWTLVMWQLAERYYKQPGLARRLEAGCPASNIRPKSVDLIPLLQSGDLDYFFGYASDARLAELKLIRLPPEINLGDFARAAEYASASVEVGAGSAKRRIVGAPIAYGATLTSEPPNRVAAIQFLEMMAGETGRRAATRSGLIAYPQPFAVDAQKRMPPELGEVCRPLNSR
ncbi:MAG: extracellular solute-binding protein [Candidatus Binataceae bacterium]